MLTPYQSIRQQEFHVLCHIRYQENRNADENTQINLESSFLDDETSEHKTNRTDTSNYNLFQLDKKYIVTHIKSGLLVIDQQSAHERILYDKFSDNISNENVPVQQLMFTEKLNFSPSDSDLLLELSNEFKLLGFNIKQLSTNEFEIVGKPADLCEEDSRTLIEKTLEHYKNNMVQLKIDKRTNFILSMAKNLSVKHGKILHNEEMQALVDSLFSTSQVDISPSGNKIKDVVSLEELANRFI